MNTTTIPMADCRTCGGAGFYHYADEYGHSGELECGDCGGSGECARLCDCCGKETASVSYEDCPGTYYCAGCDAEYRADVESEVDVSMQLRAALAEPVTTVRHWVCPGCGHRTTSEDVSFLGGSVLRTAHAECGCSKRMREDAAALAAPRVPMDMRGTIRPGAQPS